MRHLILSLAGLAGLGPAAWATDPPKPVKVFVLAGQSNMEGQAVADLGGKDYNDGKGTLKALLNDPAKAPLVKHLRTETGAWAVRDDVWVRYRRERQPLLAGPLTVGFETNRVQSTPLSLRLTPSGTPGHDRSNRSKQSRHFHILVYPEESGEKGE